MQTMPYLLRVAGCIKKPYENTQCGIIAITRIRPQRIAAKRSQEIMAVILTDKTEYVKWIEEQNLDLSDVSPITTNGNIDIQISSIEDRFDTLWEEM